MSTLCKLTFGLHRTYVFEYLLVLTIRITFEMYIKRAVPNLLVRSSLFSAILY